MLFMSNIKSLSKDCININRKHLVSYYSSVYDCSRVLRLNTTRFCSGVHIGKSQSLGIHARWNILESCGYIFVLICATQHNFSHNARICVFAFTLPCLVNTSSKPFLCGKVPESITKERGNIKAKKMWHVNTVDSLHKKKKKKKTLLWPFL